MGAIQKLILVTVGVSLGRSTPEFATVDSRRDTLILQVHCDAAYMGRWARSEIGGGVVVNVGAEHHGDVVAGRAVERVRIRRIVFDDGI